MAVAYSDNDWGREHQIAAARDGWGLFANVESGGPVKAEIRSVGDKFDSDMAAVAHVGWRAIRGDRLAKAAFDHFDWSHNTNLRVTEINREVESASAAADNTHRVRRGFKM